MNQAATHTRRSQGERRAAMRQRLIEATIASLVAVGYARTTTVEVCMRAGVTRGALNHHFASLSELLAATLEHLYQVHQPEGSLTPPAGPDRLKLQWLIDSLWARLKQPDMKAIIELWLAARNEPELGQEITPVIAWYSKVISPQENTTIIELGAANPRVPAFYRLAVESMIGMALGRATDPTGEMGHEQDVLDELARIASSL